MKKIFWLFIMVMAACFMVVLVMDTPIQAQPGQRLVTPVSEMAISTAVIGRVHVSTHAAGRVDNGTIYGLLSGRTSVRLCNDSSSTTLRFGFNSDVSTKTGNTRLGEKLSFGTCKNIAVAEGISIYCLSEAATGSLEIVVTQGR